MKQPSCFNEDNSFLDPFLVSTRNGLVCCLCCPLYRFWTHMVVSRNMTAAMHCCRFCCENYFPRSLLRNVLALTSNCPQVIIDVGSVRLSFIVTSSFSESRKRMAGEEVSLFTANLNVKVVPERFVHSVRSTNKLIVVSIICVL